MLGRSIQACESDHPDRPEVQQPPFLVLLASEERDTRFSGTFCAPAFEYCSSDRQQKTNVPSLCRYGGNPRPK